MVLENEVAVVTGGASGLGAATAKLLREKGMKVALVDIDENKLAQFAETIGAKSYCVDVTNAAAASSFFDTLEKEIGTPKVLINCAGIATPSRILGKQGLMSLDFFQKIININLVGSFNMLRLAAEKMIKLEADEDGQRGVIISTASIAAYEGQIGQSAYAASKAAIVRYTETLAEEVRDMGIDVNAIAPGALNTQMLDEILDAGPDVVGKAFYDRSLKQKISGGAGLDMGSELALFLASPASDGISAKLISAVWDKWEDWPKHLAELSSSDAYTLRRIVGKDRGYIWGDR